MRFYTPMPLLTSAAIASGTLTGGPGGSGSSGLVFPASNSIMDSYAYSPSQVMETWPGSFDDYAAVDDIPSYYGRVELCLRSYTCWGVTTGSAPIAMEMIHVPDGGGFPDGTPTYQEAIDVECENTGYTFAGYPLWQVYMYFDSAPVFSIPGWLGAHRANGVTWYVACGTEITGIEAHRTLAAGWAWEPFSASIGPGDIFKIIEDWYYPAVTRNTWAGVKSSFMEVNE